MPSKLLIAAVEINHERLFKRVREEKNRFVGFVKKRTENISDKIIGYEKLIDANTISVNEHIFTSKSFVIATGSRPFIPASFDNIKDGILNNENIFEIEKIPSIAVFGAGVIGPHTEHISDLPSWAIEKKSTLQEMLEFPFYYHPVVVEEIRTALRNA